MTNAATNAPTTVTIRANGDFDDCLTEAAERYIASHPDLEGWDLDPRWADESRETVALTVPAWAAATDSYYAVCDANGPISVLLEADTEAEAIAAFAELDGRAAIDGASTDLEDELDIDGADMNEEQFAAACEAAGARPVRGLEGDGNVRGAWHLWVLPA